MPLSMSVAHPALSNPPGTTGSLAAGSASIAWLYGPEHQRIRESFSKTTAGQTSARTLYVLHPDNEGSLYFEREVKTAGAGSGTAENRHYLSAEKGSFLLITSNGAIQTEAQSNLSQYGPTQLANAEQRYWHKDHLGSIVASTNSNLTVIERLAYDPFGKRRFTNGAYDQVGTIDATSTSRGFTGHEHLDELDFIHMNARVYDPDIGRFLSPDPTIPLIYNPQAYNRYAYTLNNPLNLRDPTGFSGDPNPGDNDMTLGNVVNEGGAVNESNLLGEGRAIGALGSTPDNRKGSRSNEGLVGDQMLAQVNPALMGPTITPMPGSRPVGTPAQPMEVNPKDTTLPPTPAQPLPSTGSSGKPAQQERGIIATVMAMIERGLAFVSPATSALTSLITNQVKVTCPP
jgi:RHS repeat-associated protein